MLSITKNKDKKDSFWNFFSRSTANDNASVILDELAESFSKEIKLRLRQIDASSDNLSLIEASHLATDNLTNVQLSVKRTLRRADLVTEEVALRLLDDLIRQTSAILQFETILKSSQATAIGVRTLNLLFCAKQSIKQKFSVITPLELPEVINYTSESKTEAETKLLPSAVSNSVEIPRMIISSTLLYQLHHSLFPAERMLIGAGRKNGQNIEIEGIFDVTGKASSGYVKADANRLGRALIVMSETEKYFALWIHSHPGRGKGATHQSTTDINQEAEWLKDYSPNLVNAILVEDGFIRFWGKAIEEKRITVEINGAGIIKDSANESIYRLEL